MTAPALTPGQQTAYDALIAFLMGKTEHTLAVLEGYAGTGKLQPLDEPVLTPSGWVRMGDIKVNDWVIAADGTATRVLNVFPGNHLEIYRVHFSDGSWTECCKDHLWKVQTKKQSQIGLWNVYSLEELLPGIQKGSRLTSGGRNKGYLYRIPLCSPVQFPEKPLQLDPYLLGYILGDGHSSKKQNSLRLSVWEVDIAAFMSKCNNVIHSQKQYGTVVHVVLDKITNELYNSLGLRGLKSSDKFIPPTYLLGSVKQRRDLLAGLMDSDGSSIKGKASFSTTSKEIAQGVVDLVRSLGGLATTKWYSRESHQSKEAHIAIRTPFNPFTLPRKAVRYSGHLSNRHFKKQIVAAEYVGTKDGQCLLLDHPDHLYITRDYIVTHNTFLVSRLLADLTQIDGERCIAIAAPTNKAVRVLKDKLLDAGVVIAAMGDLDGRRRRQRPEPGCTCRSIHAFLGLKLKEQENGQQDAISEGESSLRDYDLVVIDECSMLDDVLFKKITLERGQARILFVGDPAQLPPVKNQGTVLSPAFDRVDYKLRLSEVVRQAKDNPIIRLSIALRQLIEINQRAEAITLLGALPPVTDGPKAALVSGTRQTLIDYWLYQQIECPESDIRIIAYTNDRVQYYNQAIHQALYPDSLSLCFAPGERVIVHSQCEALKIVDARLNILQAGALITSEELRVESASADPHPLYPSIAANTVRLRDDFGNRWLVYVALDVAAYAAEINTHFATWRQLKAQADSANTTHARDRLKEHAKDASSKGWALKKAFAPLRHAYAITAHKSQGSTFDCALVDFSDLAKMTDAFSFNRALYVAVTRSREFLALVVTTKEKTN